MKLVKKIVTAAMIGVIGAAGMTGGAVSSNSTGEQNTAANAIADVIETTGIVTTAEASTTYTVKDTGRSDDTSAIQSALKKAKGGGTVKIYAGDYNISDTLIIYNNTTLELADGATINRNTDNKNTIMLRNAGTAKGYNRASNITVTGGTWDGNITKTTKGTKQIMYFSHAKDITLKNCTVQNSSCKHMVVFCAINGGTINNVIIQNQYYNSGDDDKNYQAEALHLDLDSKVLTGGSDYSETESFSVHDGTVNKNITVNKCKFINLVSGVGAHFWDNEKQSYGTGLTIQKNTFKNIDYNCMNIYGQSGITVTGNSGKNFDGKFARLAACKGGKVKDNTRNSGTTVGISNGIYLYKYIYSVAVNGTSYTKD